MEAEKILMELIKLIRDRNHFDIEPLPHKTWLECFDIQNGLAILHYHIRGDKSSRAVHIELKGGTDDKF